MLKTLFKKNKNVVPQQKQQPKKSNKTKEKERLHYTACWQLRVIVGTVAFPTSPPGCRPTESVWPKM